ncbi:MAG: asparagine synthase (glutamine-hydrolyzing) [bacterium]|nr:asparagine synthase (glutamine-hydrolyzing) [bacterium]
MCGIAGVFGFAQSNFQVTESFVTGMREAMAHRGPDGFGTWISTKQNIGLGHRRLEIIDLSEAASQPMANEDGSLRLVFNGAIYNYALLREELEKSGRHQWKTDHSDAEVILHAFEEWGIACVEKLYGMFAFALWDEKKHELWLARDHIGIKPLYYSVHNNRITFASEIKALLTDPGQKRALNEEAFFHYLSFRVSPAPHTMFAGIKKLQPGSWLRIRENGDIFEHRFWNIGHNNSFPGTLPEQVNEDDIAAQLYESLKDSVQWRGVSDVPVGIFLSGGIDSTLNSALFSKNCTGSNSAIKTFSVGYKEQGDSYRNELHFAEQAAQALGVEFHKLLLSREDLSAFLPEMARLQDEPLADPVCIPLYYLSCFARDNGVKVCQVGEGADELFCGYEDWKRVLNLQRKTRLPLPGLFKKTVMGSIALMGRTDHGYYEWLRRDLAGQPLFWGGAESFTETMKRQVLSQKLRTQFKEFSSWEAISGIRSDFEQSSLEQSDLNWMSYLDLRFRLPDLLLMRIDKMTMAAGLEARVPFLDYRLVELALRIPADFKLRNGELKYILKQTARGHVPENIRKRKKQGFSVPMKDWLFNDIREYVSKELLSFCDSTGLLDKKAVSALVNQGLYSGQVWTLLNFVLWWKCYLG